MKNHLIEIPLRACLVVLAVALVTLTASAQTTTTRVTQGASSSSTEVRKGDVVYVSGNELVVKMEDGQVKHFTVPQGSHFTVDGKQLTVHQLTPGMHLTQKITTTTTPQTITTVRSVSGTVWFVNAPKLVILTLPDGTNRQFKVPPGQKFTIDGQEKTVFDLRKGMKVVATAVSQTPENVVSRQNTVSGRTPTPVAAAPVEMPPAPQVGTLLVEDTTPVAQPAADKGNTEPKPKKLPKTASSIPLAGLLGLLAIVAALGLRTSRRLLSY
jgi:hypothetical protein